MIFDENDYLNIWVSLCKAWRDNGSAFIEAFENAFTANFSPVSLRFAKKTEADFPDPILWRGLKSE